ncbi:hypothetical protein COU54_04100, partial [Candidatus Pacearchaeota archaeon CG10_big_fil_rev_8_21_14_0_10_31_24]
MVFKKYTYRNGKKFGPYYYRTDRVNGEVVTTYLGRDLPKSKDSLTRNNYLRNFLFLILSVALVLSLFFFFGNLTSTGRVSLDLQDSYKIGENISGNLKLGLASGELIPSDSKVVVSLGDKEEEFILSELISRGDLQEGNFYVSNVALIGNGKGYGVLGSKKVYPEVDFDLRISKGLSLGNEKKDEFVIDSDSSGDSGESE